jgi:hypothetical protein
MTILESESRLNRHWIAQYPVPASTSATSDLYHQQRLSPVLRSEPVSNQRWKIARQGPQGRIDETELRGLEESFTPPKITANRSQKRGKTDPKASLRLGRTRTERNLNKMKRSWSEELCSKMDYTQRFHSHSLVEILLKTKFADILYTLVYAENEVHNKYAILSTLYECSFLQWEKPVHEMIQIISIYSKGRDNQANVRLAAHIESNLVFVPRKTTSKQ